MSSGKEKAKLKACSTANVFIHSHNSDSAEETFTILMQNTNVKVERIVSSGQVTPVHKPYIQENDEWVVLLQGEAEIKTDEDIFRLKNGDSLFIPAGLPHWVTYTSKKPECIWIAVHDQAKAGT
ncbi:MAG: cupin domain-containing protein [Bacteroidota bacterium]